MNDPYSDEDRAALRRLVTDFTTERIVPYLEEWEERGQLPRELPREAAEIGLLGIGFPDSLGGSGGDLIDVVVMTEAILEAGASGGVISALFTHGISLPHVIDEHDRRLLAGDVAGADHLAETIIRPTLAGEMICSLGVTEPDGGSDVARLRTKAERSGDEWSVTGAKTFITSGVRADRVVTAVRTPESGEGAAGITLMVLDPTSPGYAPPRALAKMGWWCSDTAELSFDAVPVNDRDVLGLGEGLPLSKCDRCQRNPVGDVANRPNGRDVGAGVAINLHRPIPGKLDTRFFKAKPGRIRVAPGRIHDLINHERAAVTQMQC